MGKCVACVLEKIFFAVWHWRRIQFSQRSTLVRKTVVRVVMKNWKSKGNTRFWASVAP